HVRLAAACTLRDLVMEPVSVVPRLLLVLPVAEGRFRAALIEAILAYDDIEGLLQDSLDQPGNRILPALVAVAEQVEDQWVDLWLEVLNDRQRSYRSRANAADLLRALRLTVDDDVAAAVEDFEKEGVEAPPRRE